VPVRVSPTDRVRGHIDDLFAQDRPLPEILEEVARLGAQLLMQAALEAEITEFLGRDRYVRAARTGDARPGSRNGYREVRMKTTAGPVALSRPKLRGTTEAFALAAVRQPRHQDQRPGIPGDRLVHPRPVGPGRGGHLG
jgi:putative transposase